MSNRTGKPGAIPATELKAGQKFRYDTVDAMASTPLHACSKAVNARGVVEVKPFCDPAMTTWLGADTFVFPVGASRAA